MQLKCIVSICSCLLIAITYSTAIAVSLIHYVGDQSTFKDNNGTASFHDGLNWLNYRSPGGHVAGSNPVRNDDANGPSEAGNGIAWFDQLTDYRPGNIGFPPPDPHNYSRPTYIYFGDFWDERVFNTDKLVPGGIAKADYISVHGGVFTFDLGSNNGGSVGAIDLVHSSGIFGGFYIGNTDDFVTPAELTIRGGGTVKAHSTRIASRSDGTTNPYTGILRIEGEGTNYTLADGMAIGGDASHGTFIVRSNAKVYTNNHPNLSTTRVSIYGENGSGNALVESNAEWIDTGGIDVNGANASLEIRTAGKLTTSKVFVSNAARVLVTGVGSSISSAYLGLSGTGVISIVDGGNLKVGTDSTLTGTVIMDQGSISIQSSLTIGSLGKLGGRGTIAGVFRNWGGAVSPGNTSDATIGVLTIDGSYHGANGGQLKIDIAGTSGGTQHDRLVVTGSIIAGGNLQISLANGFVPSYSQSFDLIDWGSITGQFSDVSLPSLFGTGLAWDRTKLYLTGRISVGIEGDFNADGKVDAADYTVWRDNVGSFRILSHDRFGGQIGSLQYNLWKSNFNRIAPTEVTPIGVPEPSTFSAILCAFGAILFAFRIQIA